MQNFCLPVVLTDVRTGLSFHCWYASRDQYTAKITNTTKTTSHNNLSRINNAPSNMYEIPPMVALAAYSKTVCFPALEEKEGIHFLMAKTVLPNCQILLCGRKLGRFGHTVGRK